MELVSGIGGELAELVRTYDQIRFGQKKSALAHVAGDTRN